MTSDKIKPNDQKPDPDATLKNNLQVFISVALNTRFGSSFWGLKF